MNMNERVAALEKEAKENGKTIWRIFEAVYGNGKPGLIADVQAIRQIIESQRRGAVQWQWLITTLISAAAVVVAIIALNNK